MSFRNAATVVIARIFQLLDSLGRVRMEFSEKTSTIPVTRTGYAIDYNEPTWQNPDSDAYLFFFGNQIAGDDFIYTALTAETDAYYAIVRSQVFDDNNALCALQAVNQPAGSTASIFVTADVARSVIDLLADQIRVGNTSLSTGENVICIANASVVPSTNPVAGGVLYVQAGALMYRGSAGTVTPIAPA